MKRFSMAVGACLTAMFCQVCVAQTAKAQGPRGGPVPAHPPITKEEIAKIKEPPVKPVITDARLAQIQKDYSRYRKSTYTDGISCKPKDDLCQNRVTVYMFQWTDASTNERFCLGLIPKFVLFPGTGTGNSDKRIVWELKPLYTTPMDPPGSTFEFLGDGSQGILVFQNIGSGGNEQLVDGKRGSEPSNQDVDKFHMKNKHKLTGTAAYLPIIVHRIKASSGGVDDVAICGTPDPLIYNVQ